MFQLIKRTYTCIQKVIFLWLPVLERAARKIVALLFKNIVNEILDILKHPTDNKQQFTNVK